MFYRQKAKVTGDTRTAGLTHSVTTETTTTQNGSAPTKVVTYGIPLIAFYDIAFDRADIQFTGGTFQGDTKIFTPVQFTMAHEMGHAVGYHTDPISPNHKIYSEEFFDFVDLNNIDAFTQYSHNLHTELWPEAFALFHLDPEWMQTNYPELFTWFDLRF